MPATDHAPSIRAHGHLAVTGTLIKDAFVSVSPQEPHSRALHVELDTGLGAPFRATLALGTNEAATTAAYAKLALLRRGSKATVYCGGSTYRNDHALAINQLMHVTEVMPQLPPTNQARQSEGREE